MVVQGTYRRVKCGHTNNAVYNEKLKLLSKITETLHNLLSMSKYLQSNHLTSVELRQ